MESVITMAGALLIAFVIKAYAMDVYVIPTSSMETALHGRPDGGDRVFCSKIHYRLRSPERWEVAVFKFPDHIASEEYEGQNFINRVVGLPGEYLSITRGDIWVKSNDSVSEYSRIVKPDEVQRGMWLNVYEQDFSDISAD